MTPGRAVQGPDRSIWPSAARGAGAARFGLPSAVRGIFGVGWLSHCALAGSATADETTIAMVTVSAPFILTSKAASTMCRDLINSAISIHGFERSEPEE